MKGILRRYNKPSVSINKIIEMYEYYKARNEKRHSEYREFFDNKVAPLLESGETEIPFDEKNGCIYVYRFSRHNFGKTKSWGYSNDTIRPEGRENRLDFLLLGSKHMELGKQLYFYNKRSNVLYYTIREILIESLNSYCRDNIDGFDRIINLNIGGKMFTLIKENPYETWSKYELVENIQNLEIVDFQSNKRIVR